MLTYTLTIGGEIGTMILGYAVVLLLYTACIQGSTDYFELSTDSTWEDALHRNDCDIATPDIVPGVGGLTVNITYNLTHDKVWLGYYRNRSVFEYIGCMQNKGDAHLFPEGTITLGLCYSNCRQSGDRVGISGDKCFCLDGAATDNVHNDCSICHSLQGLNCGDEESMSVYRVNVNDYNLVNYGQGQCTGQKNCLRMERYDNNTYATWTPCSCSHQTICLTDDYRNYTIHATGKTWTKSAHLSLTHCGSAISLADIVAINTTRNINPSWSGVVRSNAIFGYKVTDLVASHTNIWYGYLKRNKSGVFLKFGKNVSSVTAVLCQKTSNKPGPITPSTTKSTSERVETESTNSPNEATSEQDTKSPVIHTTLSEKSSSETITVSSNNVSSENNSQGSNTSVVVGASVSVIVLIALVVVALVLLRRWHKLPNTCRKDAAPKKAGEFNQAVASGFQNNPTYQGDAIQTYDSIDSKPEDSRASVEVKNNNYVHNYLVLEPPSNDDVSCYTSGFHINEATDNVYNELKLDTDATYDHAYKNKEDFAPDNDYDTAETVARKLETDPELQNENEPEADTYNHINVKSQNGGNTDNIYGIPSNYLSGSI